VRGSDDEAFARTLDYETASATSGDDTCCEHLDNHGFLLLTGIRARCAVYSLAGQHGYFGSRRPTIAAIIAIPMRKSCISIAGPIDRVPYARGITGLG
jgi:hypothetical protein